MSDFTFGEASNLKNAPILVVGWPGLGGVASSCVRTLSQGLHSESVSALNPDPHFELEDIQVKNGLVFQGNLPKLIFQRVRSSANQDLILFIPDTQTMEKPLDLARAVIRTAVSTFGIQSVMTFAAISGVLEPEEEPVVRFGTTDFHTGEELAKAGIPPLRSERIVGLNGLILLAAQELGLKGTCLVSEIPVWGLHSPNPKATRSLLKTFCSLMSIRLNFDHLNGQILALEEKMAALRDAFVNDASDPWDPLDGFPVELEGKEIESSKDHNLSKTELEELESFFSRAKFDRSQTPLLKAELDRLGVFKHYEDRFLDLFRDLS